jgi:AcrR family transcriptional regulator
MPKPLTPLTTDALRSALLDRAAELLATEGPQALSTRRIAAAAGTSTQSIYTLFGGKEGVVRAMYREGFHRLAAKLDALSRTADPLADLARLGEAYRAAALENANFYDVMFGHPVPEFQCDDDDRTEAIATFEALVEGVERCLAAGVLHGATASGIATHLWATVHGYVSLELAGYDAADPQSADADDRYQAALTYAIVPFLVHPAQRG